MRPCRSWAVFDEDADAVEVRHVKLLVVDSATGGADLVGECRELVCARAPTTTWWPSAARRRAAARVMR
jgi:hypothetical protein